MSESVIVCGGMGFCGWPISLYLSEAGYDVTIIDNLLREKIDLELSCKSLTPIRSVDERIKAWKDISGNKLNFELLDLKEHYHRLLSLIKELKPTAIVHLAEIRSAPYSMRSSFHKRLTVDNNINVTNNILSAIVESGIDVHLVHIGTTGYYGYTSFPLSIPEGYIPVKIDTDDGEKEIEIMYPPNPGSIYHLTKVMDANAFSYYNKNDNIRISDHHQGIIWGCETEQTRKDERLINRWDYDGDWGTVLNRFLIQSQVGHPLTLYGKGLQTRAFINIQNSAECIYLSIKNPPSNDRVRVLNQTTECHNISNLAKIVSDLTGAEIRYYKNPRNEDEENNLKFKNEGLMGLGLDPITLKENLLTEIMEVADKYKYRVDSSKIICTSMWNNDKKVDRTGSIEPIENK